MGRIATIVLLAILWFSGLALLVSCERKAADIPNVLPGVQDSATRAQMLGQQARRDVQAAQPHTRSPGTERLKTADEKLAEQEEELKRLKVDLTSAQKERDRMDSIVVEQQTRLDAYSKRWLGDRLLLWVRVFVIFQVVALVLGTALCGFGSIGFGVLNTVAAFGGRGLLFFVPFVGQAIHWYFDQRWLNKVKGASK